MGDNGLTYNGLTYSWLEKVGHIFPKSISPKVNVITGLEFELVYYERVA